MTKKEQDYVADIILQWINRQLLVDPGQQVPII